MNLHHMAIKKNHPEIETEIFNCTNPFQLLHKNIKLNPTADWLDRWADIMRDILSLKWYWLLQDTEMLISVSIDHSIILLSL